MDTIEYNRLITKHLPQIRALAYALVTKLGPGVEVDDLVQAAVVRLLEQSYDPGRAGFGTFVRHHARGAMLDWARKQSSGEEFSDIPDETPTPDQQILDHEKQSRFRAAVIELPIRERTVIEQYCADQPVQEIARNLGVSRPRVIEIRAQAVNRLQKRLAA